MKQNAYKLKMIKKELMKIVIIFSVITMIVLITTLIVINHQSEQMYMEGMVKSSPMLSNEILKRLGDKYIELNREFERQIKEMEIGYANRTNKRNEPIYYGVNGKENVEEMINNDYVNGIESITYVKENAIKKDGESNFADMIAVLNAVYGADIDRYKDRIEEIFSELFWLSHTYTGESTELYPCEHGCSWCQYYCGDIKCLGSLGGRMVGYYRSDKYLGKDNEYGLMYNPFKISRRKYYPELEEKASNLKTIYNYDEVVEYLERHIDEDGDTYTERVHVKEMKTDVVRADTIDLLNVFEPEGYCEVCTGYSEVFSTTTKKVGGCINQVNCFHGDPKLVHLDTDDIDGHWFDHYISKRSRGDCQTAQPKFVCNNDGDNHSCRNMILGCEGFYRCNENGHEHYACPGHILVCCFGHTNLNLKIKIMYYEEMLKEYNNLINNR